VRPHSILHSLILITISGRYSIEQADTTAYGFKGAGSFWIDKSYHRLSLIFSNIMTNEIYNLNEISVISNTFLALGVGKVAKV
jgi:hypothetical protein